MADSQSSDCKSFKLAGRAPWMQKSSRPTGKWVKNSVSQAKPSNTPAVCLTVTRSVNQPNSWRPLNITGDMFREIVDIAGASSDLLELPLSFFQRSMAVEEGFSSSPVIRHSADSIGQYHAASAIQDGY